MEIKIDEIFIKKGSEESIVQYLKEDEKEIREIEDDVYKIINDVKKRRDKAIYYYLQKFDKVELSPPYNIRVDNSEIEKAYNNIDKRVIRSFERAIERVRRFHEHQKQDSWTVYDKEGSIYGNIVKPLDRVGIYVPGGRASYPSTVIMGAVPALVAGVGEIVLTTPPSASLEVSPYVLAVAKLLGIEEIYKMGGAYAIAALAYGTESIRKVDKIVGPGNVYVTLAKKIVWGDVDIDSMAGPSEVVVIGDDTSNPLYIALDLISQAEHDPMARAILITPSNTLIDNVKKVLADEIEKQPRKDIILESIQKRGAIIKTEDIKSALLVSNFIAPEHLQIAVDNPFSFLIDVKNAGAIFLGRYASVPLGDYIAGTNHILPTGRRARFSSALGVDTFYKKIDFFYAERSLSEELGKEASYMAEVEGLFAHRDRLLGGRR